jgi:hypothetical protein
MTAIQAKILELLTQLPLAERREMVEHFYASNLFGESVIDRLSPQQRTRLDDSIAQADRGDIISSDVVFNDIAQKCGLTRT